MNSSSLDTCGVVFHSAWIASSALSAACWVGAATPTKSPSRATTTPGIAAASVVFTLTSFALKPAGRSTRPKSMPGRLMSEA